MSKRGRTRRQVGRRPPSEELYPIPQWWRDEVAAWLEREDWSLRKFAARLGTSTPTISKILSGERSTSSLVPDISQLCGIPLPDVEQRPDGKSAQSPDRKELDSLLNDLPRDKVRLVLELTKSLVK